MLKVYFTNLYNILSITKSTSTSDS